MTYQDKKPKAQWYVKLIERFEDLVNRLGLNENEAGEVKSFVLSIAREQYMSGNKSGIAWMHQKAGTSLSS